MPCLSFSQRCEAVHKGFNVLRKACVSQRTVQIVPPRLPQFGVHRGSHRVGQALHIVTPEDETGVLFSAIKKRKEAIEMYEKGGRAELAAKEREEISIITNYLPQQMTREEILEKVREIIARTGSSTPKDFGKVMGIAAKELKRKADGSLVQEVVKHTLGG